MLPGLIVTLSWRVPGTYPAPEVIGALVILCTIRNLRDVNLGFEVDNDDPAYDFEPKEQETGGLVRLGLGDIEHDPDVCGYLQLMICHSPNIKVLRITSTTCDQLYFEALEVDDPPSGRGYIKPVTAEFSRPQECEPLGVFQCGAIDLQSCTSLTFTCNGFSDYWHWPILHADIQRRQPGTLSKLKVLRLSGYSDNPSWGFGEEILEELCGLEEYSEGDMQVFYKNPSELQLHAHTLRKLFFRCKINQNTMSRISEMFRNLEDLGLEIPLVLKKRTEKVVSLPTALSLPSVDVVSQNRTRGGP